MARVPKKVADRFATAPRAAPLDPSAGSCPSAIWPGRSTCLAVASCPQPRPKPGTISPRCAKSIKLIEAGEGKPDLGFMARLMALCSLPRTNPKQRTQYVRRNGPYTLVMHAGGVQARLPYGNIPRLLLAWVCTEAVRTQRRELVLGRSLYEFMRKLGLAGC